MDPSFRWDDGFGARRAWIMGRLPARPIIAAFRTETRHMPRTPIHTDSAPAAIGPYSQATRAGNTVFFSGQIPLDPATGNVVEGGIEAQARRAFDNLKAVAGAAGGSMADIVRVGLYLTDLSQFAAVNAVMAEYFESPYPARSTIEVSALPKGVLFEVDAVMVLD